MTNEEKAGQISCRLLGFKDEKTQDIFDACVKMAEWKNEQVKKIFCKVSCNFPREKTHLCVKYGGCNKYRMFVDKLKENNYD